MERTLWTMATWESPGWTAPRSGHRVESPLRSAGWASKGSGEALHLAVARHVRARKLPLELVWIKNHPDDGSTSVYCSTDEKCRLGKLKRVQFGVADVDSQLNRLAGQRADIALPAVRPALKTVLASTPARGRRDRSLPDPRQRPGSGDHRGRLDHRSHSDRSTVHRVPSRHRHLVGDKTPKAIGVRVRLSRTR